MVERDYTISGQTQVRGLVNGALVDLYEIHYQGPGNISGWIRVPTQSATAEQVDRLIRQRLDEQIRVAQLGEHGG